MLAREHVSTQGKVTQEHARQGDTRARKAGNLGDLNFLYGDLFLSWIIYIDET